jgi:hypothetical protein
MNSTKPAPKQGEPGYALYEAGRRANKALAFFRSVFRKSKPPQWTAEEKR